MPAGTGTGRGGGVQCCLFRMGKQVSSAIRHSSVDSGLMFQLAKSIAQGLPAGLRPLAGAMQPILPLDHGKLLAPYLMHS